MEYVGKGVEARRVVNERRGTGDPLCPSGKRGRGKVFLGTSGSLLHREYGRGSFTSSRGEKGNSSLMS